MRPHTIFRFLFVGIATFALTLFIGWWRVDGPGAAAPSDPRPLNIPAMDFQLLDQKGQPVGPESLAARPSMIFFGFTYCPDICPTTLSNISTWLEAIGDEARNLNIIFITVDPARDMVEEMASYVNNFHSQIHGWTGSQDQIARAARDFRVMYKQVPTENSGYTLNHTASVFLFDSAGTFAASIDFHEPKEFAVPKIRRVMGKKDWLN